MQTDVFLTQHKVNLMFPLRIWLFIVSMSSVFGALSHAINAALSPVYFVNAFPWMLNEISWNGIVFQGAFNGAVFGTVFAAIFMVVLNRISKSRATFNFAYGHLVTAGIFLFDCWCLGGLLAVGLAMLGTEYYYNIFISAPSDFHEMLKYAWIAGSGWGVIFGAILAIIIVPHQMAEEWKQAEQLIT